MSDREELLDWVGTRLRDAEIALHNSDAQPRLAVLFIPSATSTPAPP